MARSLARVGVGAIVVAAMLGCLAGSVGAVVAPGLVHAASVTLSSHRAGTDPVTLTLQLEYEMQCGYPGPGPVVVALPPAERLGAITRGAVLVDGQPARSVATVGHTVTVGLKPPPQVMCDVIGPGRLTLVFLPAARLGNPTRPGSYALEATHGASSFSASFAVTAG